MKAACLFLVLWSVPALCPAAPPVLRVREGRPFHDLGPAVEVADGAGPHRFRPNTQPVVNFGLHPGAVWLRFSLRNETRAPLLLEIGEPVLDSLTLYRLQGGRLVAMAQGGIYRPFGSRSFQTNFFLLDLHLPPGRQATYYLRVRNSLPLLVPLRVGGLHAFFEDGHTRDLVQGLYFGLMVAVAIFNFYIFILFGNRTYLYYFLYILFFTGFFGYHKGLSHEFLWPAAVGFNRYTSVFIAGTFVFAILFAHRFLHAEYRLPATRRIKWLLIVPAATGFLLTLTPWRQQGVALLHLAGLAVNTYLFMLGLVVGLKGFRLGIFFTAIWAMLLASATVFVLQLSDVLPSNPYTRHAMQLGSALEVTLLSFAIAFQINKYRREKETAQNEAIRQLRANEQMRGRIARDLHDDIGSTLSSIAILSQVAHDRLGHRPEAARELIARIGLHSLKVQDAMSDIVWTTRPDRNSFANITVRMQEFTSQVLETQEVEYSFQIDSRLADLVFSPEHQYDLYLIYKEAVNNVAKYARARRVQISLDRHPGRLVLVVADDGAGFDTAREGRGNGLENMRRRARNLGAELRIESRPGGGTTVCLHLPLPGPARA